MLERRLFSAEPPPLRTATDDKPTLLVAWWSCIFAILIIVFRVVGRFIRTERLFPEDKIMSLAILPLLARMGLIHLVLIWGTNNTVTTNLDPTRVHHREIGSKLVLAARIMYAAALWVEKFSITEFFKERLIANVWRKSYDVALKVLRWFLLATFAAVVIATLTECHPFSHYWQVIPDPGPSCRQGYAQLLTMGTVNVVTDLCLVGFPIPIVVQSNMPLKRKISLVMLFSLSAVPVAFTVYRVQTVIDHNGSQQTRSLWASIELLAATSVANAVVLGSFVRDRGPKKIKFKFGSATDSLSRPSTRREGRNPFWGSDEDLVRGLGLKLKPDLRSTDSMQKPRPAPVAVTRRDSINKPPFVDMTAANWRFPTGDDTTHLVDVKIPEPARSPGEISTTTARRVSFFDVGGLLEEGSPPQNSSASPASSSGWAPPVSGTRDFAELPGRGSRDTGSTVLLQDLGGLLQSTDSQSDHSPTLRSHIPTGTPREAAGEAGEVENSNDPRQGPVRSGTMQSLQDVGGLLTPTRFHYPNAYQK
ncbi:MAG: hypothetical protein M1825_001575 [Sarcosagium campestre]|nr:MAG: hypothetical protein M1825_001575 [Sarcosagium campestre]